MTSALHQLVSGCLAAATSVAGIPATYRRGGQLKELSVIRGERVYRTSDGYGASITARQQRMFLTVSDLVLPEFGAILPRSGDVIEISGESETETWEVSPNPDDQTWSYTDDSRSQICVYVVELTTRSQ